MNALSNTAARFGQVMVDLMARYLNLFGDGGLSHFVAVGILVAAAALIVFFLVGGGFARRKTTPSLPETVPEQEPRLYGVPPFVAEVAAAKPIEGLSLDLQEIRASLASAIDGLAEERRAQAGRILTAQDEMRLILSKVEASLNGMLTIMERNGARADAIDLRLDALREAVTDLGTRQINGADGHEPQFPSHLPVAKITAEIAEIVRELQAN